MKTKSKIFSSIALFGSSLFALILVSPGVSGHLFSAKANQEYLIELSNTKNDYQGSGSQKVKTELDNEVSFSFENCASSTNDFIKINDGGYFYNNEQITSIESILPEFSTDSGAKLKFRAAYKRSSDLWGEWTELTSKQSFRLSSHPYYFELKAEGGAVYLNNMSINFTCVANPDAETSPSVKSFNKVTDVPDDYSGTYLIVNEASEVSFDGSLDALGGVNVKDVDIINGTDKTIAYSDDLNNSIFTITKKNKTTRAGEDEYSIKSKSGYYIGGTNKGIALSTDDIYSSTIKIYEDNDAEITSNGYTLRYNAGASMFRFYNYSQAYITLYKLEGTSGDISKPVYESGIVHTDNKSIYTVSEKFDDFVGNDGLNVSIRMSDETLKPVSKTDFSYEILDSNNESVSGSVTFPHTGSYTVVVHYGQLCPIQYTINVVNVTTSLTVSKTTTSYSQGATIDLSDVSVVKNYLVEGSSSSISYADFASNDLTCILKNPNGTVVSSGTFNVSGYWTLKVALSSDPTIYDEISLEVAVVSISSITLNKEETSLYVGGQETLTATVSPSNATDKTVTWSTSNSSVASVSNGTITANAVGSAVITARAGNFQAQCRVTVSPISVTGISLNKSDITLNIGDTEGLNATISPANATNKTVVWTSSNENAATVTADGLVSAVGEGTSTITVTTNDGHFAATCFVTCQEVAVSSLTLSTDTLTLYANGGNETVTATVLPAYATNKTVSWSIDDTSVATISPNGANVVITPISVGTATLTATAGSKTATCSIEVSGEAPKWTLVEKKSDLVIGRKVVIAAAESSVAMSTTQNSNNRASTAVTKSGKYLTWDSSAGVQEFTLQSGNQSGTYAFYTGSGYIYAASSSKNYLNTEEELSNNSSWTVDLSSGVASIIAQGNYTHNVLQYNSTSDLFSCYGTASQKDVSIYTLKSGSTGDEVLVTDISLSPSSSTLEVGENVTLTPTISPDNATTKLVSWESDDTSVARVNNGVVTAVGAGTCTITATATDGSDVSATASITVKRPVAVLTGISISNEKINYSVGETFVKPTVTATYNDGTTANVTSSATFNGFNSQSAGSCTITVSYSEGSVTKTLTYNVTIISSGGDIPSGDEYQITFKAEGSDNSSNLTSSTIRSEISTGSEYISSFGAMDKVYAGADGLKMSSSNTSGYFNFTVSTDISSNEATGIRIDVSQYNSDTGLVNVYINGGTNAVLTADTSTQTSATAALPSGTMIETVKISSTKRSYLRGITFSTKPVEPVDPTGITINPNELILTKGQTSNLSIAYTPSNANQNKGVTWSSDNPTIATVSSSGVVTAMANGTAHITATSLLGFTSNSCTVTVKDIDVSGISVSPTRATVTKGATKQLTATISPYNATNQGVTWSSSNTSLATVDSNGLVSTKAAGTVTITATAQGNTSYKANAVIDIVEQSIDKWTILLYVCGADLESKSGLASGDFAEILKVNSQPNDVNIVIQTGGSNSWKSYGISGSYNQRYHVESKSLVCDNNQVYSKYKSMGSSTTLADFVGWGMQEYPAEKTGLVLWNHGGAMRGVCYDEKSNSDSLLNSEIKTAVTSGLTQAGKSGEKLEFLGFDACLMQAQDIAEFASGFANYMIASQESEAGYGWDYDNWVDDLYAKKSTETILTAIVDSFISDNGGIYAKDGDQTLSWLNLAYMAEYKTAFENFAAALTTKFGSSVSKDTFYNFMHNNVKFFGGESDDDEYFGMFDVMDFLNKIGSNSSYNPGGSYISDVKTAFNKLVKYSVAQRDAGNANGLCCIYSKTSGSWLLGSYYSTSETNFTKWRTFVSKYGAI